MVSSVATPSPGRASESAGARPPNEPQVAEENNAPAARATLAEQSAARALSKGEESNKARQIGDVAAQPRGEGSQVRRGLAYASADEGTTGDDTATRGAGGETGTPTEAIPSPSGLSDAPANVDGSVTKPDGGNLKIDISGRPSQPYEVNALDPAADGAEQARIDFKDGTSTNVQIAQGGPAYTVEDIAKSLSYLPKSLREGVDNVNLDAKDKGGALAQTPYGDNNTIHVFPAGGGLSQGELGGVFAHEAGHSYLNNNAAAGQEPWTSYQRIVQGEEPAASPYAKAGDFEDFAEATELYVAVKDTPLEQKYRDLLPERFAYLDAQGIGD